jgi:ABC-type sugar transport system substrate-binding protein
VLISTPSNSKQPLDPNAAAMVGMAFDQYGYSTMKYIAKKYPHAKVAFVGFGPPNENLTHIVGSAKYWAKEMGLNVLGQVDALDPSPNATTVATQAILGKYPDVQIIVGYNDYTAMAAAAAVRASGKTGILVATPNGGQDITAAAMKNGSALTAYRNPWEKLGNTAAIAAYDILTKQNLPAKRMLLIGESATQENVSSLTFVH